MSPTPAPTLTLWRGPAAAALLVPLLAAAPLAAPSAATPERQKVIIVLDSSGSMAGKIRGRRKIDIARGVIRDLLKSWSPRIDLGLIAYGHRRKGSCSDIQTIYRVGKADPGRVMAAVNRLRPRGKTPLGASVLRAAKALKYTEEKATVILVSDGRENCGVDPCKLGRELKKNGVDFTAHVIGFKLKRGEDKGLRCLAANTGGRYFAANDARQLAEALRETVKQVQAAPPPKPAKPAPKPEPKATGNNVRLGAVFAKGGKRIDSKDLRWEVSRVSRIDDAGKTKEKLAWLGSGFRRYGPSPVWKLEPGEYEIAVTLGNASAKVRITVTAGRTVNEVVNLDAGAFKLGATYAKGGDRITDAKLRWEISRVVKGKGPLGSTEQLKVSWLGSGGRRHGPEAVWLLNAGEYEVTVYLGNASRKFRFTVKAGETGEAVVNLDAGAFKLSAIAKKGGDPVTDKDLRWEIFKVVKVKGALGSPTKVRLDWLGSGARRHGAAPIWLLNAGEYEVAVYLGNAVRKVRFTVEAGKEGAKVVALDAGIVALSATDPKTGKPTDRKDLRWEIFKVVKVKGALGSKPTVRKDWLGSAGRRSGPSARWLLNAGEYEVTVYAGKDKVTRRITVIAGETRKLTLVLSK